MENKSERKVLFYKVVYDECTSALEQKVNELIRTGWEPSGGITTTYLPDVEDQPIMKYQAMILREEPRKNGK